MRKLVILVLALVGLLDSLYLLWVYTSPSSPMVCLGGGCDAARASSYSHVLGIPLPVFGVVMYVFLALLVFIQPLFPHRAARMAQYGAVLLAGAGFVFSVYLMGVEAFKLHAWCMWCVLSALVVTGIFILSLLDLLHPAPPPDAAQALDSVQKNFALILFAVVIGVPAFIFLTRRSELPPSPSSAKAVEMNLIRTDTHFYGDPNARVTIVEFGDFECPACRRAEATAHEIREKFGNRIRFAFRQFPLRTVHAQSEKAAEASECAAEQGKFWQAVDKLYANQNDLSPPALSQYASEMGLDSRRFVECLQSGRMLSRVTRDLEDGQKMGVHATPTFFINGRMFVGPMEYSQFEQLVEQELAEDAAKPSPAAPKLSSDSNAKRSESLSKTDQKTMVVHLPAAPSDSAASLLGGLSQNALSGISSSATACSEAEAKKRQPGLIRTPEAKTFFQNDSGSVFVDVRAAKAFQSGHIPGALNLPIDEFEQHVSRLPKDKTIVLYESGRSTGDVCAASRAAGRILLAQGFEFSQVKVYQDGLAGWEKARLPIRR